MSETPQEILAKAVRVGGTWDTLRAVTALRDAGIQAADERAREKQARHAMRKLRDRGILVLTRQRPVEYRTATLADTTIPATYRAIFNGGPLDGQMIDPVSTPPLPRTLTVEQPDGAATFDYTLYAINEREQLLAYRPAEQQESSRT